MMKWPVVVPLVYYFSIPVSLYVVYPWKDVVKWSTLILLLMVVPCVLSYMVNYPFATAPYRSFYESISPVAPFHLTVMPDIIIMFLRFFYIGYSLYYIHRIHEIKVQQLVQAVAVAANNGKAKEALRLEDEKEEKGEKYEKIYALIAAYMESRQPYLRPDFTLATMANDLNINTRYLSEVINIKKEMNFNNYVNLYRVNNVKELIRNNPQYTLQHIYLSSGFNSQSSFNKAFKLIEGITPSEYANKINQPEGGS
ncbi:MAG: helix-turn-helix domain-containing protein [Tannerellaceae bacterium]|nr:helix-turn-helix domain-containing protein [Tannerellaceae bacterium]